jgi:hypothetical protein
VHQLRHRSSRGVRAEQALCFIATDVERVREWLMGWQRIDEVALHALRDQDREAHGHHLSVWFDVRGE